MRVFWISNLVWVVYVDSMLEFKARNPGSNSGSARKLLVKYLKTRKLWGRLWLEGCRHYYTSATNPHPVKNRYSHPQHSTIYIANAKVM